MASPSTNSSIPNEQANQANQGDLMSMNYSSTANNRKPMNTSNLTGDQSAVQPPAARKITEIANNGTPRGQPMTPNPSGDSQIIHRVTHATGGTGGLLTPPPSPPRDDLVPFYPESEHDWNCGGMIPDLHIHQTAFPCQPQNRLRHDAPDFVPNTAICSSSNQPQKSKPSSENCYNLPKTQLWMIPLWEKSEKLKEGRAEREALEACKSTAEMCVKPYLDPKPTNTCDESGSLGHLCPRFTPPGLVAAFTASQHRVQRGTSFFSHDLPTDGEQSRMLSNARWVDSNFFAPWFSGVRNPFPSSLFGEASCQEGSDDDDDVDNDNDDGTPNKVLKAKKLSSPFLLGTASSKEEEEEEEEEDDDDDFSDNATVISNPWKDEEPYHNGLYHPTAYCEQYESPNRESSAMAERQLTRNNTRHGPNGGLAEQSRANARQSRNAQQRSERRRSRQGRRAPAMRHLYSVPQDRSQSTGWPTTPTSINAAPAPAPSSPTPTSRCHQSVISIPHHLETPMASSRQNTNGSRRQPGRSPHHSPTLPLRPPPQRSSHNHCSAPAEPRLSDDLDDNYDTSLPGSLHTNPSSLQPSLQQLGARDTWGFPPPYERPGARGVSHPAPAPPSLQTHQQPLNRDSPQRPSPPTGAPTGPKGDKMRMNRNWRRGNKYN